MQSTTECHCVTFRLNTAQEELDVVTSQLREKQERLNAIESKVGTQI